MYFVENKLYHIYNRGNNAQKIFLSREDYLLFLKKIRQHISPYCEIISWCLMPNHFHLLVYTTAASVTENKVGGLQLQSLANGIKLLLSSYTKTMNKQQHRTGNLFQQKTKAKQVTDDAGKYAQTVFHYIHQNPWRAGLIGKMEWWEFSSFREYIHVRNGSLVNQSLAKELLDINDAIFYQESYQIIPAQMEDRILKGGN